MRLSSDKQRRAEEKIFLSLAVAVGQRSLAQETPFDMSSFVFLVLGVAMLDALRTILDRRHISPVQWKNSVLTKFLIR